MIPIGKKCPECSKIHLVKSMEVLDSLSPKQRTQLYRSEHRIFDAGYFGSLDMDNHVWEFYLPLSVFKLEFLQEKEPEKKKTLEEEYGEVLDASDEEDFGQEDE
jgi:hypothetical protein